MPLRLQCLRAFMHAQDAPCFDARLRVRTSPNIFVFLDGRADLKQRVSVGPVSQYASLRMHTNHFIKDLGHLDQDIQQNFIFH